MKKLTLKLTVKNGKAPTSAVFSLFKNDDEDPIISKSIKDSFSFSFDLENNTEYRLYISGTNPISQNKKTIIELIYEGFDFHGNFKNPTERTGEGYFVRYSFNTK